MLRQILTVASVALTVAMAAGCASMTSGGTQQISFQSVPDGVVVTLLRDVITPESHWKKKSGPANARPTTHETRILGKTPFTLQLDRADGQSVTFSKDGYTSMTMPLTTETNPAVWGNILVGGFFGTTTDSISGAIYEYVPNQYLVTLNPLQASLLEQGTRHSARDQVRLLLIRRYDGLLSDLSRGHGEDLGAAFALLRVTADGDAEARRTLSLFARRYPDAAVFATQVAERYLAE